MKKMLILMLLAIMVVLSACSSNTKTAAVPSATPAATPTPEATTEPTATPEEKAPVAAEGSASVGLQYEVKLVNAGEQKLEVVKAVRDGIETNLVGAKDIVDAVPSSVAVELTKEEADKLVALLEAAGATVEVIETEVLEAAADTNTEQGLEVVLVDAGPGKLNVVKAIRDALDLDLAGAKAIVDEVPSTVINNLTQEEADALKAVLEEVGATVEIR